MAKIESRLAAQTLPSSLKGRVEEEHGVKEGKGEEKGDNIVLMEKANGASLPEFTET